MVAKASKYWSDVEGLMFLCSGHGISYCSEFSTTTNYHAARESLSRLVASEIFPKFGDFVEREETRVNSCNREKNLYFYIPHLHSLARDYSFSVSICCQGSAFCLFCFS